MVAFQRSQDETEIRVGERAGGTGGEGYSPGNRRHFWAEEKIRIVLEGLRGEDSIGLMDRPASRTARPGHHRRMMMPLCSGRT